MLDASVIIMCNLKLLLLLLLFQILQQQNRTYINHVKKENK